MKQAREAAPEHDEILDDHSPSLLMPIDEIDDKLLKQPGPEVTRGKGGGEQMCAE